MKAKKTIQDLQGYPTPLFDESGYLKLDGNESDFGPSPKVIKALQGVEPSDVQYYPFYGELLQKLARFHGVNIENIVLTAGADEAISSIIGTFTEYGQTVLTVCPSFVMPKIYSKINGLNYLEIPYNVKWQFPTDAFLKNIEKADLIHLTTPNSPTGEVIETDVIKKVIQKAGNKPVLIDETYGNYAGVTNLEMLKDRDNIFIVRSFSKDFALAGLRLGYIISAPENIKYLRKYLSPYNVSNLTVKAGLAALDDVEYLQNVKTEMEKSKEVLVQGLTKLGAKVYPSKTNFLCIDFGVKADFVYHKLLLAKIKVKYFNQTQMLKNCFRIAVPKIENSQKVLDALKIKPTIAFDMDGVLVDASKSYRVAAQKTFAYFSKKEISMEEISEAKKLGGLNNDWDLTEYLLKKRGFSENYDDIVEVFQGFYKELADIEEILIDKNFLEKLSENFNLAIFTGRLREEAYFTLEKHGLTKYFCPIVTLEDVTLDHQKPDCKGIKIIKEKIITDKIYYLGDTVDDMICANVAEVTGVGVLPPQDKSLELKNLLKSKNAMVVLDKTTDLIEFLRGKQ
ncbi:MAG: aminotransferase class I/II-fold pyridoxal phosphate-dependent enzyme [Candidatus Gastranaerophilales bacterium]|nr:aminotransferase class I/II-fold pyridoxal phosphate-dependent enzyme [Candidatus Gastranaerophilales bacterium]